MPKHAKPDSDAYLNQSNSSADPSKLTDEIAQEDDFLTPEIVEEGEYPDALDSLVPDVDSGPLYYDSSEKQLRQARAEGWSEQGNKEKKNEHYTVYQKKSRRMRRVLIVVIILILILIGALGYFTYVLISEAQNEATQQVLTENTKDVDELKESDASDETATIEKLIEAPNLKEVIGKTQEEAVGLIGHGASEVSSSAVEEENNPVKRSVRLSLNDDPSDINSSSTPTVYLELNAEGKIISAGYSAAVASLGYDISSFTDAVNKHHIVENTLAEIGLSVPEGEVQLPEDKTLYSKYDSTGDKLTSASYSFSGHVEDGGVTYDWSSVVRFDYVKANSSGNLKDTIAQIYVYISNSGLAAEAVADEGSSEGAAEAAGPVT